MNASRKPTTRSSKRLQEQNKPKSPEKPLTTSAFVKPEHSELQEVYDDELLHKAVSTKQFANPI